MTVYEGESPAESSRAPWIDTLEWQGHAPRVNQVDADELDEALVGMLSEKVQRSLANFKSAFDLKPEVELVVKLLIFRFGIWSVTKASPGAKLQNLKLVTSHGRLSPRRTLLLYLLLHPPIFPKYLVTRIRHYALSRQWPDLPRHDWRRNAWTILDRIENAARMWELCGWIWFLKDGRYPSLLMRVLRLRLVPSQARLTRLVSYEFMNRQLVWSALTEFLMFSVPLLPPPPTFFTPSAVLAPIKSFLSQPTAIDYTSLPLLPPGEKQAAENAVVHRGPLAHLPRSTCPLCHLRLSSAPVPLDSSTAAGSALTLPRISGALSHEAQAEDDEMRIYVPAQTDCEGGCRWCYYCIGQELYKHGQSADKKGGKSKGGNDREGDKWTCLRCGGGVARAWRVGAEGDLVGV